MTIEYRESKQFGTCREAQVGLTAELVEGEDAGDALHDAKVWVRGELAAIFCEQQQYETDRRRAESLEGHLRDLRDDAREYEERIEDLRRTWEQAKKFLLHHGLDAELYVAGLPFRESDEVDDETVPADGVEPARQPRSALFRDGDDIFQPTRTKSA